MKQYGLLKVGEIKVELVRRKLVRDKWESFWRKVRESLEKLLGIVGRIGRVTRG